MKWTDISSHNSFTLQDNLTLWFPYKQSSTEPKLFYSSSKEIWNKWTYLTKRNWTILHVEQIFIQLKPYSTSGIETRFYERVKFSLHILLLKLHHRCWFYILRKLWKHRGTKCNNHNIYFIKRTNTEEKNPVRPEEYKWPYSSALGIFCIFPLLYLSIVSCSTEVEFVSMSSTCKLSLWGIKANRLKWEY